MKKTLLISTLTIATLFAGAVNLKAADEESWYKINVAHRLRTEEGVNAKTLDGSSDIIMRNRTILGATFKPMKDFEIGFSITNEAQTPLAPRPSDTMKTADRYTSHGVRWAETFFDKLYIKYKTTLMLPMTFTLGRQTMSLGEGFLIQDPSPGDGSRAQYYNAIRGDMELAKDQRLTVFFNYNPSKDNILPMIDESHKKTLTETYDNMLGVYYSGKVDVVNLEGYFLRKHAYNPAATSTTITYTTYDINNIGARCVLPFVEDFSGTVEAVYQFGKYYNYNKTAGNDVDAAGYGAYMHLDYNLTKIAAPLKKFTLGGLFLSGDDPSTKGKNEGFDPMYGRYPKWNESYLYTFLYKDPTTTKAENVIGYWSNYNALYANLLISIADNAELMLGYQRLGSQYACANLTSTGTYRGDLFQFRVNYTVNKFLTGHVVWDNFRPASFYPSTALRYNWVRFQVEYNL